MRLGLQAYLEQQLAHILLLHTHCRHRLASLPPPQHRREWRHWNSGCRIVLVTAVAGNWWVGTRLVPSEDRLNLRRSFCLFLLFRSHAFATPCSLQHH